ncbi:MAG: GntR family transcriptional regulator [Caldimonas sp.]
MSAVRPAAPTQLETVLTRLREAIMRGRFAPNARLEEKQLAEMMGVSRTPVRIAMQSLAQERLLVYNPHRGFQVRSFSRQDVIDAIDVRGRLEAFSAELAASRGLAGDVAETVQANLVATRTLLDQPAHATADVDRWAQLNADFHRVLLEACGNPLVGTLIGQIQSIPMASAGLIPTTTDNVDAVFAYVGEALAMHTLLFDAILRRQPARAHSLMLEHVYQGRERILQFLEVWPGDDASAQSAGRYRITDPAAPPPAVKRRRRPEPGR